MELEKLLGKIFFYDFCTDLCKRCAKLRFSVEDICSANTMFIRVLGVQFNFVQNCTLPIKMCKK